MELKTDVQKMPEVQLTPLTKQNQSIRPHTSTRRYTLMGAIGLLAITGIVMFVSTKSLPGDTLYPFKTEVTEPIFSITALSQKARIDYLPHLLEIRLAELLALSIDQSTSTSETLARITELTNSHIADALKKIKQSTLISEERITQYTQLAFIAGAEKSLIESTPEFSVMEDAVTEMHGQIRDAQREEVYSFSATSTPEAIAYLTSQIQLVSNEILSIAPGSAAKISATRRINDAEESIMETRMDEAIISILKAREAIAINQYLFDAERIPEDGAVPEVDQAEIPEGN